MHSNSKCDRHFFIKGDICDRETVEQTLRDYQIDTIIHFAAESHVDNSIADPAIFVRTNVVGTFVLLDAAKQFWIKEQPPVIGGEPYLSTFPQLL